MKVTLVCNILQDTEDINGIWNFNYLLYKENFRVIISQVN